jgi:4-amino-4-deoxy-L-arabinose transferase-like glycosyltransferase
MSVTAATTAVRARPLAIPTIAVPVALYIVAFAVRVAATFAVTFPLSEGSAYYVAVARNIAQGRGPVIDALWSYATPPLTLPRPAFELWQPLASVIAAWPMSVLGTTSYASAQLGFAAVGALLAPLAWLVARDASARLDLPDHRQRYVALGAGFLTAVAGPFVLSAAIPDSTLPFTVLAVASCVVMPKAARGDWRAIVALGLLLGLAYLTRMEAVYLGVVFVAAVWLAKARGAQLVRRVGAVAVVGGVVALPWWIRNFAVFGTPTPGQLSDNAFLTHNEQIFAWQDHPSLSGFLAQGVGTIAGHIGVGESHNLFDVLIVPGVIIVVPALITLVYGWHRRAALMPSPLWALLWLGALTFVIDSVLFPVATLWGTFEHASGPFLVGLAVVAVLGGDALVARVRARRNWPRPNAGMAPAALAAVALALTAVQLGFAGVQARDRARDVSKAVEWVRKYADSSTPIITDHPIWLSDAVGVPTLALPDEGASQVVDLAQHFGATNVVVLNSDVRNTDLLVGNCFAETWRPAPLIPSTLRVLTLSEACR